MIVIQRLPATIMMTYVGRVRNLWKRIGVIVCKKSAYPNCSVALTNCSGTLISVPEHL